MKNLFLCLTVFLLSGTVQAADPNVVNKQFFGVRLGESIKALKTRVPVICKSDVNDAIKEWEVKTKDSTIRLEQVKTFENKVSNIMVLFKDSSKENKEAIKSKLTSQYGEPVVDRSEECAFYTKLDGVEIFITLITMDGQLAMSFSHLEIEKKAAAEIEKTKQKALGDKF